MKLIKMKVNRKSITVEHLALMFANGIQALRLNGRFNGLLRLGSL